MKQITEDYVSYEVAVLLKEKGFDGECIAYFSTYKDNNTSIHRWRNRQTYVNVKNDGYTIVPTHQMALKWLREVHGFIVTIDYDRYPVDNGENNIVGYGYNIQTKDNPEDYYRISESVFDSYEEAVEAAIKYTLENLI